MTQEERDEALRLLRDPNLLERIVSDFDVVGETTNKLFGYLAAVSRKLDQPLAVIIQSSSAAGKTSLMDGILSFVPPEDQVKYSAMTGQMLFYMGETNLKHKILAIVEEEGAERASYALKLLQSEGALTIASTGKDSGTGRLVTQEYRVEGPVMLFLTTTAIKIDEELLNRCLVLSVDENREQTKAIHQFQRRRQTLAGLLADQDRKETLALHRNAQRLLRPLLVANPYAESLTFLDDKTRSRRDHLKYLTLIRAVALLHQYQRPVKTTVHHERTVEYIEVTLDDIAVANRLACEVLGRSVDELPPQTRRLLNARGRDGDGCLQAAGDRPCRLPFQPPGHPGVHRLGTYATQGPPETPGGVGVPAGPPWRAWAVLRLRTALRAVAGRPQPLPRPADRRGAVAAAVRRRPVGVEWREVGQWSGSSRRQVGPKSAPGNRRKC